MKILILNGSPRPDGNTAAMIDAFLDGAKDGGHEITVVPVCQMKIAGCLACEYCHTRGGGKCIQQDDMQQIYPILEEAEMIILASPVYYHSFTGQLQCAINRIYALDKPKNLKRAALFLSSGSDNVFSGAIYEYENSFLNYLKLEDMGVFTAFDKENKSEEKMRELYAFGRNLKLSPGRVDTLWKTDPEFMERFAPFAFDEVVSMPDIGGKELDGRLRYMAILSVLLGCQGVDEFKAMLPAAMDWGVTPVEIKETVYQAAAYLGMGRVRPFMTATNDFLTERGVPLPLEGQAQTTMADRREKGSQAQAAIFGEHMVDFWRSGPEESRHINRWLAANCFGDYYTRTGLDYAEREMITFCFLYAQGGCEPQLISHAAANMRMGNDKPFLIKVISQCLPFIGYPRTLNALRCINEAAGQGN